MNVNNVYACNRNDYYRITFSSFIKISKTIFIIFTK